MIWVLLQGPNDGYYTIVGAASDKHFNLIDAGWVELESGVYINMLDLKRNLENYESRDCIFLFCYESLSTIQTTEECLNRILELEPNYLDNKEFV